MLSLYSVWKGQAEASIVIKNSSSATPRSHTFTVTDLLQELKASNKQIMVLRQERSRLAAEQSSMVRAAQVRSTVPEHMQLCIKPHQDVAVLRQYSAVAKLLSEKSAEQQ